MLWAGLASLGIVVGLVVLHPGRGLGFVEDPLPLPTIDLGSPLPSVDLPLPLPLPTIDLGSPLPLPSVDLGSPLPLPSVDLGSPLPSVDLGSPLPLPSAGPSSPLPSVGPSLPQPGVDEPDQPSTGPGLDVDPAPSAPGAPPGSPAASVTPRPTDDSGLPGSPEAGDGLLGELTLPALVVGIPLLVLLAFIATQVAAGAAWLPVIRRVLGRGRPGEADAAHSDRPQEPSTG